jgi:hypothetical protein
MRLEPPSFRNISLIAFKGSFGSSCRSRPWLRFLAPLVTLTLDGPATHQSVEYYAGIPKNPVILTRADIDFAIEKARTGKVTQRQLQHWQACYSSTTLSIGLEKMRMPLRTC